MTKQEYAEYVESVDEFFRREGIQNLSTGHIKCPDCQVEFECSECPECGKDAGEFPVEPYFSWRPMRMLCRGEAGDRYDATGYNPTTKEVQEYSVCQDCIYFAEFGTLDDQTMLEIEVNGLIDPAVDIIKREEEKP